MVQWEKGNFLTLPAGTRAVFHADADAALYWVHDEPLLRYLGAEATTTQGSAPPNSAAPIPSPSSKTSRLGRGQ